MNYYYTVGKFLPYIEDQYTLEFNVNYRFDGLISRDLYGPSCIISADESLLTYTLLTYGLKLPIITKQEFSHLYENRKLKFNGSRVEEEHRLFLYTELS